MFQTLESFDAEITVSNRDVRHEVTLMHVNNNRGLNNDFRTIVSDS